MRCGLIILALMLTAESSLAAELKGHEVSMAEAGEKFAFTKWPPAPDEIYSSIDFQKLTDFMAEQGVALETKGKRDGAILQTWEVVHGQKIRGTCRISMFDSADAARNGFLWQLDQLVVRPETVFEAPSVGEVVGYTPDGGVVTFLKRNVVVHIYSSANRTEKNILRKATDTFARAIDSFLDQVNVVAEKRLGYAYNVVGLDGPFKAGQPFVIQGRQKRNEDKADEETGKDEDFHLLVEVLAQKLPELHPATVKRIDSSSYQCVIPVDGFYYVYTKAIWNGYIMTEYTETIIHVDKEDE